ncbi:uncharacterized protein [Malus domestica]|uniref:uncharacterized protein n=1 Tax=Malus domestica TaxID=3750 RepID=UPI0010AB2774|nr:uncharacterized protein LOC103425739 [Malus domestica]
MSGADVRVWVDRWLPSLPVGHPVPIGEVADESVEHLFLMCPCVAAIWFGGALNYRLDREGITSWANWLQAVFNLSLGYSAEVTWVQSYVAFTCWSIWKARCNFVFNQVPVHPMSVLREVAFAVGSYWEAEGLSQIENLVGPARQCLVPRWIPPTSPFFKINVDASWSQGSKSGFVGVVMRAEGGSFVAAARYAILSPSVAAAEACALLRGCELGSALGCSSVILESDSRESISCLSGNLDSGSWEAFPILARVKQLSEAFQFCRWSWVPRLANSLADFLASVGCPEMCDRVWVDRPPSSLVHVLNKDGLPCPP